MLDASEHHDTQFLSATAGWATRQKRSVILAAHLQLWSSWPVAGVTEKLDSYFDFFVIMRKVTHAEWFPYRKGSSSAVVHIQLTTTVCAAVTEARQRPLQSDPKQQPA